MKKLILFLMLSTTATAQDSYQKPIDLHLESIEYTNLNAPKSRYNEPNGSIGLGLISGGALFMTAGFLTVPDYETQPNSTTTTKPFFRQGARMMAIMTGAVCLTTGIVISIGR
jgi:hypothetical protein